MKGLIMKFSTYIAAMALMVITLNMNTTCMFVAYQAEIPEEAKKLRKF